MSSLTAFTSGPSPSPSSARLKAPANLPAQPHARRVQPPTSGFLSVKAALDWILALVLLVLSSPVLLLAMLLVKLTSRGPAVYTQTRVGLGGRPFTIFKLRSMTHHCESLTGPRWATPGDSRVTPVGRFLRFTHLDELPQLWNVLRGEMSLIGPRPERPEFTPQLEQAIPHYHSRLLVRPGLTGLAQVQLPPDSNLASVRLKLAYDLYYVRHVDFWLDARILMSTGFKVLGVPFWLLRRLFGFTEREQIEGSYAELCQGVSPVAGASAGAGAGAAQPIAAVS